MSANGQRRPPVVRAALFISRLITRVAPLASWTNRDVWRYAREHGIELLSLYDLGYTSIGWVKSADPAMTNLGGIQMSAAVVNSIQLDKVSIGTGGAWFQGGSETGKLTAGKMILVSTASSNSCLHALVPSAAHDAFAATRSVHSGDRSCAPSSTPATAVPVPLAPTPSPSTCRRCARSFPTPRRRDSRA